MYDIHGNLPALEAVLADLERERCADELVVGGDVLWGPMQSECIDLLLDARAVFVAGNCERDVLHPVSSTDTWCNESLSAGERAYVASWPSVLRLDINDLGTVIFCHATPLDDMAILTRITPDGAIAAALAGIEAAVVVCGHTHVQFDRRVPRAPRLVNAGSVGLPYEGRQGAFWALLGPDVQLRRTGYEVEPALAVLQGTEETGFPGFGAIFEPSIRGHVEPDEATTEFESRRGT